MLTERPDLFDAWDSLDDASKKLYTRQMEVYAGFMDNADWNVGRLLDAVEEMGDLDNTLILYIWGDNGASLEGTTTGSFNEMTFLNGVDIEPKQQLELIDKYGGIEAWGSDHTAPHIAAAWAWAGNTPFQWGKQMASHLGGTRNPMVVAWPTRIKAGGDLRSEVHALHRHGPTILEAAGIPEPKVVDGIEQEPMDGTSFLYTFDDPDAEERHTVQYFEVIGSRAIYKDGGGLAHASTRSRGEFCRWRSPRSPPASGTRAGHVGAVLPARRLHAGERRGRREPGEARRAEGAVLAGGGAQPRCRCSAPIASSSASSRLTDRHPLHVRGRRPEHPERVGAQIADARRDRGGARDPRRRRRRRHPRQRRLHRRIRALAR